jgi:penicillin-binding protein 2
LFDIVLDYIKKILKSRLFPITIIFIGLFSIIIYRLFVLQIVNGPVIAEKTNLKDTKTREIKSTRGNIYDRNGKLLASNVLSYSVMMEDSSAITSNEQRNKVIHHLINIIENNGDTLDNKFFIRQNENGEFEFTVEGSALTRFKKNAFAYMMEDDELTQEQKDATAEEVYEFLKHGTGDNYTDMFGISDEYSVEDTLKIMSIRYALFCNYPKYLQITVASNVSEETVAEVMEEAANLPGVEIKKQTQRYYHDSLYFAHILGYTGLISAEELEKYDDGSDYYNYTDVIGKSGLEKEYESYLSGIKGREIVTVGTTGKVIGVVDRIDPVAGNDVYLTIDSELQKSIYHILEKKLAGILLQKIVPDMNYGSKGESASDILTPIYEVYFALINNNIIDVNRFDDKDATELEKQVKNKYEARLNEVFGQLDTLLSSGNKVTNEQAGDMEDYLDYFYEIIVKHKLLRKDQIPEDDTSYRDYRNGNISLSQFILYCISNNWIDLSQLNIGEEYYSINELYQKLIDYIKDILKQDPAFKKKIYRNLVFSYKLTGTEICLLLFDQGVLEYNIDEISMLKNGNKSAYQFIRDKISTLVITPAMLALEPYSGSVVVTDVNTGDVLAMVTYPSYDNNKMANKVDPNYFNQLRNDRTDPFLNRPVQQKIAPGSTFKMVSATAVLEEGVVTPYEKILDLGEFTKINPPAKCHIHPGSHGSVDIVDALKVSCNYYFYETAYRMSIDSTGTFNEQLGLEKLAKYASMYGLDSTSGVELPEYEPSVSNQDSIRSSIGQGTNGYTAAQISKYITTIANRGKSFNLTLLDRILDKDGKIIVNNRAKVDKELSNIKDSTWDKIQEGMYAVVNESRGSVFNLFKDLGVTVAAKTGTSQISKVVPNNALFVSYAPYEAPEISVTSIIPNGHTSGNAAELSRDIYKLYFNLEDHEKLVDGEATSPENDVRAISD